MDFRPVSPLLKSASQLREASFGSADVKFGNDERDVERQVCIHDGIGAFTRGQGVRMLRRCNPVGDGSRVLSNR